MVKMIDLTREHIKKVSGDDFLRFLEKIRPNTSNNCMEWIGSLDTYNYGLFRYKTKLYKAHRWCVEFIQLKNIPKGSIVRHICDNPRCVNPDHLELGSKKDNAQDREKRNRSNRRNRDNPHGKAKLTTYDIIEGIEMFNNGSTRKAVASYWKVSYAHACKLIKAYNV